MNCPVCGRPSDGKRFCAGCGHNFEAYNANPLTPPVPPVPPIPQPTVVTQRVFVPQPKIPPEYEPISPWAYWGLSILFSIPIVGFIFLIIFSCSGGNLNRRNYARSYFCSLIFAAIIVLIWIIIAAIAGVSAFAFIENMG